MYRFACRVGSDELKKGIHVKVLRLINLIVFGVCFGVVNNVIGEEHPTVKDYDWWRKARFGVFISWGPSSVLAQGGESWQRGNNPGDYMVPQITELYISHY